MRKVTTEPVVQPVDDQISEADVLAFSQGQRSTLDELVRRGAQQMLQAALEQEVQAFVEGYASRRDQRGNRLVVRNGYKDEREILTGAGPLRIQQPRVRDKSPEVDQRVQFSSNILPPYLRRSKSIEELIPWLYLKGVSTGDFQEALQALLARTRWDSAPTSS